MSWNSVQEGKTGLHNSQTFRQPASLPTLVVAAQSGKAEFDFLELFRCFHADILVRKAIFYHNFCCRQPGSTCARAERTTVRQVVAQLCTSFARVSQDEFRSRKVGFFSSVWWFGNRAALCLGSKLDDFE